MKDGENMAKNIAPTPVLEEKDAFDFLLEMEEPATKEEIEKLDKIMKKDLPILL